eukprot:11218166-Lingulodinium_polyedra.AAC.1
MMRRSLAGRAALPLAAAAFLSGSAHGPLRRRASTLGPSAPVSPRRASASTARCACLARTWTFSWAW